MMIDACMSDVITHERREDFSHCHFVGPKRVLDRSVFTLGASGGRPAAYKIIVSDSEFQGKLNFLLGSGEGTVRIDGKGSMNIAFRLYRYVSIHIKEGTTINQARIVCDNSEISVGRNGLWSDEIIVQSNDQHGIIDLETLKPINAGRRKIFIDDHVWVGRRSRIMPDVEIGRESIIAACACVTSDVESNSIYAGVPARKIRSGITWSRSPNGLSEYELDFLGYARQ